MFEHSDDEFRKEFIPRVDALIREKRAIGPKDIWEIILDIEPVFVVLEREPDKMNKVIIGMWNGYVNEVLGDPDILWDDDMMLPVEIPEQHVH